MEVLPVTQLDNRELISAALKLEPYGYLAVTAENLVYLDINDDYIHQLFLLFHDDQIKKPDYFGQNLVGAHISVIYPEENTFIDEVYLGKKHYFKIKDLCAAIFDFKKYYVITIESDSLLQLRKKYGLSEMLCFRGYLINFHITIGVDILV